MKPKIAIFLLFFSYLSTQAQHSSVKMKLNHQVGMPGRSLVYMSLSDAAGVKRDSCLLGTDSCFSFSFKVNGIADIVFNSSTAEGIPIGNLLLFPNEHLQFGFEDNAIRDSLNDLVTNRFNQIESVLSLFDEVLYGYTYGLEDSVTYNIKVHELTTKAQETLLAQKSELSPVLYKAIEQGIVLKAGLAYARYPYYAAFQQKHKTINAFAKNYFQFIGSSLNQALKLSILEFTRDELKFIMAELDSVNYESAKLSDINYIKKRNPELVSYNMYTRSDGPNCTYGYAGSILNAYGSVGESLEGWFISPQFDKAEEFSDSGFAIVERSGLYQLINYDGENVLDRNYEKLLFVDGEYYIARSEGAYGLINRNGNWILPFAYERLTNLGYGLLGFQPKNSPFTGVMHWQGQVITPARFNFVEPFEGYDFAKTVIYEPKKWVRGVTKGSRAPGEKYGVINREGLELLRPGWYMPMAQMHSQESAFPLAVYKRKYNNVFHFFRNKQFFLLSDKGEIIQPGKQYANLNMVGKHLYFASNKQEGVCRTINGKWQSRPFQVGYRGIQTLGNDYFFFDYGYNTVLIKDQIQLSSLDTFDSFERFNYSEYSSLQDYTLYKAKKNYCYGLLDENKRYILPIQYDTINYIDSLIAVKKNGYFALYDTSGKQYTSFHYKDISIFGTGSYALLEMQTDSSIQICNRELKVLFEAKGAEHVWLDGSDDTGICNWSYLKDGFLYQNDRKKNHFPYLGLLHHRYLFKGNDLKEIHLVSKKGEWLGVVEDNEPKDSLPYFLVKRFDENLAITPDNKKVLEGNYQSIDGLYYNSFNKDYSTYSYDSDYPDPTYYLCTTQLFNKGLVRSDYSKVLDTVYQEIELSRSMMVLRETNYLRIADSLGNIEHTLKFKSRRSSKILFDRYIRVSRAIGGYRLYNRSGVLLGKYPNGNVTEASGGTYYVLNNKKNNYQYYDGLGKKKIKDPFSLIADPGFNLMLVQEDKKQKWVNYKYEVLGMSEKSNKFPLAIPLTFVSWLDTAGSQISALDTTQTEFLNLIPDRDKHLWLKTDEDVGYQESPPDVVYYPLASTLKQKPLFANAICLASWLEKSSGEKGISINNLGSNFVVFNLSRLNDGAYTDFNSSYFILNDSLNYLDPYGVMDKMSKQNFARLLTKRITADEAINWDVCVKPEEQFRFLDPQFRLKENGVEVVIRKLKVQNKETNDLVIFLSKEELMPYLRKETAFYRWMNRP